MRMTDVTPDHAGFRDAQRRLREHFGEPVEFLTPAVRTYPEGTALDPETGEPYDPTVRPITTSDGSATVSCTVAFRTTRPDGAADFDAIGVVEEAHVMLIADIDDRGACEPADRFIVRAERYRIVAQKPDGVGGVQRWLVYGRRT